MPPCSTGKKPSVAASSRATRSSAAKAGPTPVDVQTAPSTMQQSLPKLHIPAGKLSHSTTPTTATLTATQAPSPTKSESSDE